MWCKLTSAWFIHWSTGCPLVLMWIVPLDAGEVRHAVVSAHNKYEAEHDTDSEVDPLICHGGYHFPGILAGVVPLHAVWGRYSRVNKKNTVVTKSKYKIGLISQRSTINRPQSECCIDFRKEKSTTTYFTNSLLLLLLLFNIHFCHIKKLFQVANTLIATSTNSVGRSPNLTTVKWTQNTSNLGLFCCMRGHTSHWGEKKIVPKDSLSKHILLKGFGSQGNKQQRRCSPEIHSNNRGLTSSTLPGTLSMKLQQPLLLWLLFTH